MAKRIKSIRIEIECDPVSGTHSVQRCYYQLDDSVTADVLYTNLAGPNPCPARDVEASELSGTLQAFMDGIKTEIETQEGI